MPQKGIRSSRLVLLKNSLLTESTAHNERNRFDWISLLQAVLSTYVALNAFGLGFAALLGIALIPVEMVSDYLQPGLLFSLGLSLIVLGCLLTPSALIGYYQLRRLPIPGWLRFKGLRGFNWIYLLFLILILAAGMLLFAWPEVAANLLPFLSILAICLPILIYINIGTKDITSEHPQRHWGVFAFSLAVTPSLIIFVELFVLSLALVGFSFAASANPELQRILFNLSQQFSNLAEDPESLLLLLRPLLSQPLVVLALFFAFTVIIPIVEEILKTISVWLLSKRIGSAHEGYVVGILSGAGFALMEGLFSLSGFGSGEEWLVLILGRMGGSLLHVFTGGLIGWGLTSTWQEGRGLKYALSFFSSILVHGLWNGIVLCASVLPIIFSDSEHTVLVNAPFIFYILLVLLATGLLIAFTIFSNQLRTRQKLSRPTN